MLKVLIVEDEELIRTGLVRAVDWASMDAEVVGTAANGEEGLAAFRKLAPDLILTDLKMPKMDGLEMVRQIREEGSRVMVIILTAYDTFSYAQSAIRLGAVDFLVKPFHDGEIENAVARVRQAAEEENRQKQAGMIGGGQAAGMDGAGGGQNGAGGRSDQAGVEASANPAQPTRYRNRYVRMASEYILNHYQEPGLCVQDIAQALGISDGYLSHTFKKETGKTMVSFITGTRMQKAGELLLSCRYKVYEVAEMVGYRDINYFSATFKKVMGCSPMEYMERHA